MRTELVTSTAPRCLESRLGSDRENNIEDASMILGHREMWQERRSSHYSRAPSYQTLLCFWACASAVMVIVGGRIKDINIKMTNRVQGP